MVRSDKDGNEAGVALGWSRGCGGSVEKTRRTWVSEGERSHLNVTSKKVRRARGGCSDEVSGQGVKLGLVKWGGVPTAEMVGDGVVAAWDVLCSQLEIEDGGQEPNLPEAGLHARGAGAA